MGVSFLSRSSVLLSFCSLFFVFRCVAADAPLSFSFRAFQSSEAEVALDGDARVVNSTVRITYPRERSRGRITYRGPLAFGRNPSFSTSFSFSVSPGEGDGLAFWIAPRNVQPESLDGGPFGVSPAGALAVVFDTAATAQSRVLPSNSDHVRIRLGGAGNVSGIDLVLNGGEKLQSWVEYDGDSRILEVTLSRFGSPRPSKALVSCPLDPSGLIWKNAMSVGISCSSGNSTQTCTLYSWAFQLKHGDAYPMHSEPLDPGRFPDDLKRPLRLRMRGGYLVHAVCIGLMLGAACGAVVTIAVLLAWAALGGRRPVTPVEFPVHPADCEDEKSTVAGERASVCGDNKD